MSDNKELIRDMLNSIIKGDTEAANATFSDISYAFSQSALGIKTVKTDEDDTPDEE